jgi:WD40 repeat protein
MPADIAPDQEVEAKTKIFISYSRKDMAFVDRLDAALKARGYEPLIDRADIYAFEDWRIRLENLIAGSDTVLFVLSPDAVASPEALKEVEYAATLNKRFAPIVCRRVDDEAIPERLRELNLIFFDDPERFEASADQLAEALRTDIAWIRQHTEYGEEARRWGVAGRPGPRGLLLRSPTLEEAERWIAARPGSAPEPTEETRAFIAESRRAATQRRNVLSASLGAGLLIALVLAGLAFWQRAIAVEQRAVAGAQRETALTTKSRLLAAQAVRATGQADVQTGMLLSLEALRSPADGGPEELSTDAEKSLLDALYRNPLRAILRAGSIKYKRAVLTFDASVLVAIAADNTVSFWTIDDGSRVTGKRNIAVPFGPVTQVFANPARPILVFRGKDNGYFAWNYQTGQMVPGVTGTCSDEDAKFSFDSAGTRLFVHCADVAIFAFDTGKVARAPGKFDKFAVSPDGSRVVVSVDDKITVMDGDTAAVVTAWQQKTDSLVGSLGMSGDGKTVLIQSYEGIDFRNAATGAVAQATLKTGQARTFDFAVSPAANVLVADGDDGTKVWNVDRAAPIQQLQASYYGFLPNGFLVTGGEGKITLWEYPTEGHTGTKFAVDRGDFYVAGDHSFLAASADGRKVVTLSKAGDLYVWSGDPAMLLRAVADNGERLGTPAVYSADGKIIVTTAESGLVTIWDAATLGEIKHIRLAKPPALLAVDKNANRLVYVTADADFDILDVATLRSIKPAGLPDATYAAALSPDGATLALGGKTSVTLWRVADGSSVAKCSAADAVGGIVWTDSGKIAYAMDHGTVALLAPDSCTSTQIFSFTIAPPDKPPADADIRAAEGLILANLVNRVAVWSEAESKTVFDATRQQWPVFDESAAESTLFDILPGRRVIVGKQPDGFLEIYDLATKDKILSFAADTNDCCMPVAMIVGPGGERLMTLWSERGAFRLRTWQMLPTAAAAIAFAENAAPECLSRPSRKALGLDGAPPRWCIEMQKRPYDTPQWRQWLADEDAGKSTPMPAQ